MTKENRIIKIKKILENEHNFIVKILKRSSLQFKNHLRQRKLIFLNTKLDLYKKNYLKTPITLKSLAILKREEIIEICENIFIICSSEVAMGHYLPVNLCVMASVSRISYLLKKL